MWAFRSSRHPAIALVIRQHLAELARLLHEGNAKSRASALRELSFFGRHAAQHVSKILRCLQDADGKVRCVAVDSAIRLRGHLEPFLPELVRWLEHQTAHVRRSALEVLANLAELAVPLAPQIAQRLGDGSRLVRRAAILAVGALGVGAAAPFVPQIANRLSDSDESVRQAAVVVLGYSGGLAAPFAKQVVDRLLDGDPDVAWAAQEALVGGLRREARGLVGQIARFLEEDGFWIQSSVAQVLQQLGPSCGPALQQIAKRLTHSDANRRRTAAEALGLLEGAAKRCKRQLRRSLKDDSVDVRRAAKSALLRAKVCRASCGRSSKIDGDTAEGRSSPHWRLATKPPCPPATALMPVTLTDRARRGHPRGPPRPGMRRRPASTALEPRATPARPWAS
mmetsp:Transcript_149898/g.481599  ORF Transcript_149898/g.481599 Transcript_149898/m.481599 type:complete len:395 (+) Transcript_149898:20-1204(+)